MTDIILAGSASRKPWNALGKLGYLPQESISYNLET